MNKLRTLKDFDLASSEDLENIGNVINYPESWQMKDWEGTNDLIRTSQLRREAIKWIKYIQSEPYPIFPNKEVKIPWFGETITLKGGEQIFAAKAVLQAIFNITQEDLK